MLVLFMVVDVHPQSLSAEVNVVQPLVTEPEMTLEYVQEMIQAIECRIPLIELWVVHDASKDLDLTKTALGDIRFFYEKLWREWDRDDDGDYPYVTKILQNRLQFYRGILQEKLSSDFIRQYKVAYNKYEKKLADLKKMRKEMAASDSEQELDTPDVINLAVATHELKNDAKLLQAMENQQMRYLHASANAELPELGYHNYPVTKIVSPYLTGKMAKRVPDESIIQHCVSFQEAITSFPHNGTILICNGDRFVNDRLNVTECFKISGFGDTIFRSVGHHTFLTSQSPELQLSNIKFVINSPSSSPGFYVLEVERGKTTLGNCEFQCSSSGIIVKNGAELVMQNCKVLGALSAGLTVEENCKVHVECCDIRNNGRNGNDGGIKIHVSETQPSTVVLVENRIERNFGRGVHLLQEDNVLELNIAYGVHLELKGNFISNNTVPEDNLN